MKFVGDPDADRVRGFAAAVQNNAAGGTGGPSARVAARSAPAVDTEREQRAGPVERVRRVERGPLPG